MAQFNVYKRDRDSLEPEYIAVKEGFSFPGFFFSVIWAFMKKLWKFGFILIGVILVYAIITTILFGEQTGDNISKLLGFALAVYVGYKGNDIYGKDLIKRRYVLVGLYDGNMGQSIDKAKNNLSLAKENRTIYNDQDSNKIIKESEVVCEHCNEILLLDEYEMKNKKYICPSCNKTGAF